MRLYKNALDRLAETKNEKWNNRYTLTMDKYIVSVGNHPLKHNGRFIVIQHLLPKDWPTKGTGVVRENLQKEIQLHTHLDETFS